MARSQDLIVFVLFALFFLPAAWSLTVRNDEADDIQRVLERLISSSWGDASSSSIPSQHRSLSSETASPPACGEILDTWSFSKVYTLMQTFFSQSLSETEALALSSFILPKVKYGVQIRKVCASICSDVVSNAISTTNSNYSAMCENDYGANIQQSGLVMFPMIEQGTDNSTLTILPGSLVANLFFRGTRANGAMTTDWNGTSTNSIEAWINVLTTVTMGTVALAPDYMGYGESLGQAYKAYLIRKGYQTSVVPLVYKTRSILQNEYKVGNCRSNLSDSVVLFGYSEGGYASVAVGAALHDEFGFKILAVESGGGPLRLATVQFGSTVERIDKGIFPSDNYYYLALLGSAFSSTYRDLANYRVGQNILSDDYRNKIVTLVNTDASSETLNLAIPVNDPLTIMNSSLVGFVRSSISNGVLDACSQNLVVGVTDKVCEALEAQDLAGLLERVRYPVNICHSVDDQVVDYRNVPNATANPKYLSVQNASGTHQEAASTCITQTLLYFLGSDFGTLLQAATDSSCRSGSTTPNAAPTPTMVPSAKSDHTPTGTKTPSPLGGRTDPPSTNMKSSAVCDATTVAHLTFASITLMLLTL